MRRFLKASFAVALLLFVLAAAGRLGRVNGAYAESSTCSTVGSGTFCGYVCWVSTPYTCTWVPTYVVIDRPINGPSPT